MDDHTTSNPLPSTVQGIAPPKFRILVLGKTGCGKSSLINRVFGVNVAQVSHAEPGKADIELGFCPKDNHHFILHDSQGFEPGDHIQFDAVKRFIEQRTETPSLEDRLHAIWVCISIPLAGDRLIETGVEEICRMDHHNVPLVGVFTKYDILVTSLIENADDAIFELEDEDIWLYGEGKALGAFKELCIDPLIERVSGVQLTKVSTTDRYKNMIEKLVQVTDREVQHSFHVPSHTTPVSLAWAVAQRGNPEVSIEASIDVGRERYWSGLISSTDFTGKKLRECLDVIHNDIILIWNIRDPSNHLSSEEFKATMSQLVKDLVPDPQRSVSSKDLAPAVAALAASPSPFGIAVASIWSAILFAQWVGDVYRNTRPNLTCVMGYIIDLTVVMFKLSKADSDVSQENIFSTLEDFISADITRVHDDIRNVVNKRSNFGLVGKDEFLNEIIRLIHKYCNSSE